MGRETHTTKHVSDGFSFPLVQYKLDWNQTRKSIHIGIALQKGEGRKDNVMVDFKSDYLFCTVKVFSLLFGFFAIPHQHTGADCAAAHY